MELAWTYLCVALELPCCIPAVPCKASTHTQGTRHSRAFTAHHQVKQIHHMYCPAAGREGKGQTAAHTTISLSVS